MLCPVWHYEKDQMKVNPRIVYLVEGRTRVDSLAPELPPAALTVSLPQVSEGYGSVVVLC